MRRARGACRTLRIHSSLGGLHTLHRQRFHHTCGDTDKPRSTGPGTICSTDLDAAMLIVSEEMCPSISRATFAVRNGRYIGLKPVLWPSSSVG